jgi:hypothetical protein
MVEQMKSAKTLLFTAARQLDNPFRSNEPMLGDMPEYLQVARGKL